MATFTLYLPDALLPLIDEARRNVSRSGWIRLAVENQLAGRETVELRGAGPGGEPLPTPPAKDERSPEPETEVITADEILAETRFQREPRRDPQSLLSTKPPLQRPIIQKRGT